MNLVYFPRLGLLSDPKPDSEKRLWWLSWKKSWLDRKLEIPLSRRHEVSWNRSWYGSTMTSSDVSVYTPKIIGLGLRSSTSTRFKDDPDYRGDLVSHKLRKLLKKSPIQILILVEYNTFWVPVPISWLLNITLPKWLNCSGNRVLFRDGMFYFVGSNLDSLFKLTYLSLVLSWKKRYLFLLVLDVYFLSIYRSFLL